MYTPAFLETLRQLEETLQFPAFDLEGTYALGTRLREAGTQCSCTVRKQATENKR